MQKTRRKRLLIVVNIALDRILW